MPLGQYQYIHFIGIGGIGMSALARYCVARGIKVSGSDQKHSHLIDQLSERGANISIGHDAGHIKPREVSHQPPALVVISSAIKADNPERQQAKSLDIPIITRGEFLAEIFNQQPGIAIAGSHGKTTTSALLAHIFLYAKRDPTIFLGGVLASIDSNAHVGSENLCIAEADESDGSFLHMRPQQAVITSIDADHLYNYDDALDQLEQSFIEFSQTVNSDGLLLICHDDVGCQKLLLAIANAATPIKTYGLCAQSDVRINHFKQNAMISEFELSGLADQSINFQLNLPGKHNVQNATAAIILAYYHGLDVELIQQALMTFPGVKRRFEYYGHLPGNIELIDDYGHHPQEIMATLKTLRDIYPKRRLLLVYQPHRYTRTQVLFDAFSKTLSLADQTVLLPIYAASELAIEGVSSESLAKAVNQFGGNAVSIFSISIHDLRCYIKSGDVILVQGAGDISQLPQMICQALG